MDLSKLNLKIRMFSPYVSPKSITHVEKVLKSGYLGEGPIVKEFEKTFSQLTGSKYPVAVNSGTSAIHLAVVMAGVKPGDKVITTAQTMMATSHAILAQFAKPVFADIQYETGNINPKDIEKRITKKTKAILPVHWTGYPCDMDEIHEIAEKHSLPVIEDAAHALGAYYKKKPVGTNSPYTCFSFQAIKHVTTADGGMICLDNKEKYDDARRKRWFGIDRDKRKPSILGEPEWNVTEVGYKYHMNDFSAALGIENLKELKQILKRRAEIVKRYREGLSKIKNIKLFERKSDRESANWLFSMHVKKRVDFIRMMLKKGIEVSVVHNRIDSNGAFGPLRKDLRQLAKFTETHISIPLHNCLSDDDVDYILKCIRGGW